MSTPKSLPDWDPKRKYRGRWWPADNPELSYPGTLRFLKRSPFLSVRSPPIGQEVFELGRGPTLHGELENGEKVTLWDLAENYLEHSSKPTRDGSSKHSRRFSYAIRGEHLGDYSAVRFRRSAHRLHDLREWSRIEDPVSSGLPYEELPQFDAVTLSGLHLDEFETDYTVLTTIEYPMRVETNDSFPKGAIMNHTGDDVRVVFETTPPAPARFHDLLVFDLRALLTFSYQSGAPVLGEWLQQDDSSPNLPVIRKDAYNGVQTRHLRPSQMVLSAGHAAPADIFTSWWKLVDELFPAPQVVVMYHHASRGVLESSTSSAMAAAEHLHSALGDTKTRFPVGYLEAQLPSLIAAFPGKANGPFRQFLREAMKNNRPTLHTRLTELVALITPARVELAGFSSKTWIAGVKAVRNKLAHTGSHIDRRDGAGSRLLDHVNLQTRAVLTLLVLSQMGLSNEALDRSAKVLADNLRWLPPIEADDS
ncbi:ApeA N-terminal domain 1-containing protein [Homoserinimonas sp. A447]